jgi:hypothetical protein
MRVNFLFTSQYTSESNLNSISSCGEVIDANVGSNECLDFAYNLVIFWNAMRINLLFRSQYTCESNFNSISSCGEILGANVGSLERFDFSRVPVIFLKCHEYRLVV